MYLSIIVPTYNEKNILVKNINTIYNNFKNNFEFEIIIVNDGSNDGSDKILSNLNLNNLKIKSNKINKGKGYSILKGISESKGELILFTDADLSTPINEFNKLIEKYKKGYDFVIGSRSKHNSDVKIRQSLLRTIMGKIFNFLIKFILGLKYYDTQCGFKLFNAKKIKLISKLCKVNRFCIDVEILFLAKKLNYNVFEEGVIWINDTSSSINICLDSLNMFVDLIKIRFRNFKQFY